MDPQKVQIVERLKQATNILVTVSANPSVDQLASAIGFSLLLNKLGKHATAVFSGQVPSTIEFLHPDQTLEKTTDSLRDFIIALDKSKADKLRYKVEDQMVKIFITPYRTSITDKDLEFSQGDFNVEVVVALGVHDQQDLDAAIIAHGRILHDATVVGVSNQEGQPLGAMNIVDTSASSLSEILVELGLMLKEDILDGQMATAFLTGIVAETERFSNEKTSSETMQVSAKLMSAGANQQLVATQLQAPVVEPAEPTEEPAPETSEEAPQAENSEEKPAEATDSTPDEPAQEQVPSESPDGELDIIHPGQEPAESPDETEEDASLPEPEEPELEQIHIDESGNLTGADDAPAEPEKPASDGSRLVLQPPTMGGQLTANTEPEHLDPSTDPLAGDPGNSPLLSHDSVAEKPAEADTSLPAPELPALDTAAPAPALPSLADITSVTSSADDDGLPDVTVPGVPGTEEPAVEPEPEAPAPAAGEDLPDLNALRAEVTAAASTSPAAPEPVAALNAQPIDLNVVAPEAPEAPEAEAPAAPVLEPFPPLEPAPTPEPPVAPEPPAPAMPDASAPVQPADNQNIAIDPSTGEIAFPTNLVPPVAPEPVDPTAPQVTDPTAPPPVPPPMMPPVMPPADDNQTT